jgi:hypothetical protein
LISETRGDDCAASRTTAAHGRRAIKKGRFMGG